MNDEITPAGAITEGFRWLPVVIIGTVVAVALGLILTLVMWQAGWWFTVQNAHRQIAINNIQAKGIQSGLAAQSGLLTDFNSAYSSIYAMAPQIASVSGGTRTALIDQRLALGNKACADAAGINISMGTTDRAWVKVNCHGSTVSLTSSLRKGA